MVIACPRDCYDTCIFNENYRPLNIFPINGFTCARGRSDLKRNNVNRITSAYIDGKEVSLHDAVSYLAKRLIDILKRDPAKILHVEYDGNQGLLTWYYPARFWNVIHASSTDYSICSSEGHAAIKAHYGTSFGALPEDMLNAKAIVFWAFPASISFIHGWHLVKDKIKVVIDVRISDTAKKSEKTYLVKPGTDVLLAIGIIKRILEKNYQDGKYTNKIKDFDELVNYVKKFNIDYISSVTGLSKEQIDELVDFYHDFKPITLIGFALGRSVNGGDAIGMISLIPALLGIERGFYYSNSQGWNIDFAYLRGLHLEQPSRIIGMADVGDYVSRKEIELMFVWNSNPIVSLPMSDRIIEAVNEGRLLLAVHDPFWSETAKIANIVIPAPTFLEKYDVIYSYWHQYLIYNEPIMKPIRITETDLVKLLSKETRITHQLIEEDPWQAINTALKNTGITLSELKSKKIVKLNPQINYTITVKPLPENIEMPRSLTLVFTSHPLYTNSQFKEIYGKPEPIIYTHNIEGHVIVRSKYGIAKMKAIKDPNTPENIAWIYKSALMDLDGKPVNSLIGNRKGKYGGTPLLNGTEIIIEKLHSPPQK
ncbi:MAG: molybdopterin-dependent oxidoreductase [Thermoprotei archaeon]